MSAEQPYTDESMALWREIKSARFKTRFTNGHIQLCQDTTDQAAAAVITAAMAEKDVDLTSARRELEKADNDWATERAAHEATKAELQALWEAVQAVIPDTIMFVGARWQSENLVKVANELLPRLQALLPTPAADPLDEIVQQIADDLHITGASSLHTIRADDFRKALKQALTRKDA
jgi:hypothetical protein